MKPDTVEHPRIDHSSRHGDLFSVLNETDLVGIIIWGRLVSSKQDESPSGYIIWSWASNRQHKLPNGPGSHSLTFLRDPLVASMDVLVGSGSLRGLRHCDLARPEQHQTPSNHWFVSFNATPSIKVEHSMFERRPGDALRPAFCVRLDPLLQL